MDDWQRVRSQIEHEDTLINHRVNWAIQINAMLLAAFAAGVYFLGGPGQSDRAAATSVLAVLTVLMAFAVVVNLISFRGVRMANSQIDRIVTWWDNHRGGLAFPPIVGQADGWIDKRLKYGYVVPLAFAFLWATLLVSFWVVVTRSF